MNCKEKLEEAKRLYKFSNDDQRHVLEDLFPELRESEDEDEKIRIAILNYLRKMWANCKDNVCGVHVEDVIAWLEKQGEQKTNDNVETKFKVGDWIIGGIYNKPKQILEIRNEGYVTTPPGWIGFSFAEDMHLWTLQDAKDGDVLVSKYNQPFIYNGNRNFCHVGSYCGLSTSDKFIVSTSKCFWTENVSIRPATKEQCDLLFKKMKESGYKWDDKKKKLLNKIEPKFRVGEWLCENIPNNYARFIQILEIVNVQGKERYRISRDIRNNEDVVEFDFVEKYYHKFDIKDAKYGDVLVHNDCTFIFVGLEGNIVRALAKTLLDGIIPIYFGEIDENNDYHPATKEQRELLFKEMKKAGYEWDSEKKELKKINTFYQENCKGFQETGKCFADGECKAKKEAEQKSTWSEEDEKMFSELLSSLLINTLDQWAKYGEWLKSLKGRITWKPTEAQLASLTIACDRNDRIGFDLTQLLEELKKL